MHRASVDLRSYAREKPKEQHDFVQIVLPVTGHLEIDVSGLQERLSPARGIFIHCDVRHTQQAAGFNQSIILDLNQDMVPAEQLDRFVASPFIDLTHRTKKLLHHMRGIITDDAHDACYSSLWCRVLIDSFSAELPSLISRLLTLKNLIEIDPFQPWAVERMAQQIEISTSRLHVLFREHFDATPHVWLADVRMKKICALLRQTSLPIAEIADRAGFSDQTALTRAMKNAVGVTPAAYRREQIS